MKILAHRGLWSNFAEKNTLLAFEKAFSLGFGIETDVRDYCGGLVISHDIPDENSLHLETVLKKYKEFLNEDLTLAINIKADGLQCKLKELFQRFNIKNYFIFDMSVPEHLQYCKHGFKVFSRLSEFENQPVMFEDAEGIWLDAFNLEWYSIELIEKYISLEKRICIVSSELHGREYLNMWSVIKKFRNCDKLLLCTDFPEKAHIYFTN